MCHCELGPGSTTASGSLCRCSRCAARLCTQRPFHTGSLALVASRSAPLLQALVAQETCSPLCSRSCKSNGSMTPDTDPHGSTMEWHGLCWCTQHNGHPDSRTLSHSRELESSRMCSVWAVWAVLEELAPRQGMSRCSNSTQASKCRRCPDSCAGTKASHVLSLRWRSPSTRRP
jgi:hypothetical protein